MYGTEILDNPLISHLGRWLSVYLYILFIPILNFKLLKN